MSDVLDTRFEDQDVDIKANLASVGDDINILEKDPALRNLLIGVGWDVNAFDADTLDLDISVFMLDKDGQTRIDDDFLYYNNKEIMDGAVKHNGDSRTGAGDGDDETISIDLHGISFDIMNAAFVISIYKAKEKEQNIGMVRNAYIRIINADTGREILRYEFSEVLNEKTETAMLVAFLNREGPKWHFAPAAEFIAGGLNAICERYGLVVGQY